MTFSFRFAEKYSANPSITLSRIIPVGGSVIDCPHYEYTINFFANTCFQYAKALKTLNLNLVSEEV